MSLADTARKLRAEANDAGYQCLRKMRYWGDVKYGKEAARKKWEERRAFQQTLEALTMEGSAKIARLTAELHEICEIGDYCRRMVRKAEEWEAREKGSAAGVDPERVNAKIAAIRKKWRAQRELQVSLEDVGKDGEADGCDDQSNKPDAERILK